MKDTKTLTINSLKGSLFENLILSEFQKKNHHNYLHQKLYFWRDTNGNEIDLLLPNVTQFDIFEIKSSQTAMNDQFKGLDYFESLTPKKIASKTVIYGGEENQKRTKGDIKPWHSL